MANQFCHFEIVSPRPDEARRFYAGLFGWPGHEAMPGYVMVQSQPFAMGIMAAGEGSPAGTTRLYVLVDDLAESCSRAVSLGGQVVVPETPIPGFGSFAIIADCCGCSIGLWKPVLPPPAQTQPEPTPAS